MVFVKGLTENVIDSLEGDWNHIVNTEISLCFYEEWKS